MGFAELNPLTTVKEKPKIPTLSTPDWHEPLRTRIFFYNPIVVTEGLVELIKLL